MKRFKKTTKTLIISLLLIFNLLILANNALAGGGFLDLSNQEGFRDGEISGEFGQSSDEPKDPREIAANMIQVVLSILGIVFVVLIIYAGFKYMTAQGNEDQVSEARKQIVQGVIGLVIILAAYSITLFVFRNVEGATTSSFFMPE